MRKAGVAVRCNIAAIGDTAPDLGHPFGDSELVDKTADFAGTLSALKEAGYAAEGELGIEITPGRRTVRSKI